MASSLIWTPLAAKQPVTFYDPANVGNSFSPQLNPKTAAFTPGNVRKYISTTNGTSVIIGDREYPPMEIKMAWDEIDSSDFNSLRLFAGISPIVYVDNNDNGFLGVFMIDQVGQIAGKSAKVFQVQASLLVIAPYNGIHTNINALTAPTLVKSLNTSGGYFKSTDTAYVFSTICTDWGESVPSTGVLLNPATGSDNYYVLSYTPPSQNYTKVRIYWNTTNISSTATFLSDIMAGESDSFTVWTGYNQYSKATPPTFGTAFTGYWAGGYWTQV